MKKHICILICYKNINHIKECFNSLYNEEIDFMIIENFSESSEDIDFFFNSKKILGHIRFNENITNNAVTFFIKENITLLKQYEYITISDCDIKLNNSQETFREIIKNLEFNDVVVSCVDLDMSNLPKVKDSEKWIPTPIKITEEYIESDTGIHLMTIKLKDLWVINDIVFLDSNLRNRVRLNKKKWVKTLINKAYHLTWDLYYDGNEYYEYKKNNNIWHHNRISDFTILKNFEK